MQISIYSLSAACLFAVASASPLISTKISPCIPKSLCFTSTATIDNREAFITPWHGPHTASTTVPLAFTTEAVETPNPKEKRMCEIAFICEIHHNACGIEYEENCSVPACAGGPATPTPTGTVPTCPPSKAKRVITPTEPPPPPFTTAA